MNRLSPVEVVDRCVLEGELGLKEGHVRLLREARHLLRTRRERRASQPRNPGT